MEDKDDLLDRVFAALQESAHDLARAARVYGSGLHKVEPHEL